MSLLVEKCSVRLIDNGVFLAKGTISGITETTSDLRVQQYQTGSLRVSCLDSLGTRVVILTPDRTNLTCSLFAKYMLPFQLDAMKTSLPTYDLPASASIESRLKTVVTSSIIKDLTNVWADSGDSISLLYVSLSLF
jgi:hypothetical protein